MNSLPPETGTTPALYESIRLKEFSVTWAGLNPTGPGFCFGSEDGRLLFTDENGNPINEPHPGSLSGEAINGVACLKDWLAVATRGDLTFHSLALDAGSTKNIESPFGAHGITSDFRSYFVAPLGREGIMLMPADSVSQQSFYVLRIHHENSYFHRVLSLRSQSGKDFLVAAGRRGGMCIAEVDPAAGTSMSRSVSPDGMDVVDICSIAGGPAVAAVARDGTLLLVRDATDWACAASRRKIDTILGTAYRLLYAQGHLCILTSQGLYVLLHLGQLLVEGLQSGDFDIQVARIRLEAVDAAVVGDRWLLVVMPDEVRRYDLKRITIRIPESQRNGQMQDIYQSPLTTAPLQFQPLSSELKKLVPAA
jgi:hypothetical protein